MEEIVFIKGEVRLVFQAPKGLGVVEILLWPVPRVGEYVSLRRNLGVTTSIEGYVERVEYYYSSGNMGPVVTVYLG